MRRALSLFVVVLLASVAVWKLRGTPPVPLALPIVERVESAAQEPARARELLATERSSLPPLTRHYLDAVVLLAEKRDVEAVKPALAAHALAPADFRTISVAYSALRNAGNWDEAGRLALAAVEAVPTDERVLFLAVEHLLDGDPSQPEQAEELLSRIDALPVRVAAAGDRTSIPEHGLAFRRYHAAAGAGRTASALEYAHLLVEGWPRDPLAHAVVGEAARLDGDMELATRAYATATQLVPANRQWREHYAQLLIATEADPADLLREVEAMRELWPKNRAVAVLHARALVRADLFDAAAELYEALLREDGDDKTVLRNLAILYYDWKQGGQEGEFLSKSYRLLVRYRRLGGEIDKPLKDTWAKLDRLARQDRPELERLRVAWEEAPTDVGRLRAYRDGLLHASDAKTAGRVVREALAVVPVSTGMRVLAAEHFFDTPGESDPITALAHLDVAWPQLQTPDGAPEALLWLRCRILLGALRFPEALEAARLLTARQPDAAPYHAARGEAAFGSERLAEGETSYRAALAVDPGHAEWRGALTKLLLAAPDRERDALVVLDEHPGPSESPAFRLLRARALLRLPDQRAEGVLVLRELLADHGDDDDVLQRLAVAIHADGASPEARRLLLRVRTAGIEFSAEAAEVWASIEAERRLSRE